MSTPAFTILRRTRTQTEADLLIGILRSAGLNPADLIVSGHVSVAGADMDYAIRIPSTELATAEEILREYDASTE